MSAKSEVHHAKQKETSGQDWVPWESASARVFLRSSNFLLCIQDVSRKLRGVEPPAPLDRRASGVLEWLSQLLQLPSISGAIDEDPAFAPLLALASSFQAPEGTEPFAVPAETLDAAVEAFREALVPAADGDAAEGSGSRPEGTAAKISKAAVRTSGSVLTDSSTMNSEAGNTMHKQRLGAIQVGGQTPDVQLEVVAAPTQVNPVIQVSRSGEALLKVGASGDMQLRGSLVVQGTQDALSSANSALVSAGGLSVAKGAVIGGRVKVEATLDSGNGGAGAVQVEGGISVAKRAFFGGSVSVGRPQGSTGGGGGEGTAASAGPRSLKVMSPDDEASVVVQSGAPDKPAALELRGSPVSDALSRDVVSRIYNTNGSMVLDSGGGGVAVQGGGVIVRDEADVAMDHSSEAGSHVSASLLARGGAAISKGLHVGADISVGTGLHPRGAGSPGRAVRVYADNGPAELFLVPEAKAPARVQLGRGGAVEGRPGGVVELSAGVGGDAAAFVGADSANKQHGTGGILLTAPGPDGVQLTHGTLRSSPETPLSLEGEAGARLVSRDGDVTLQTKVPGAAVRLRPAGGGQGLSLQTGTHNAMGLDLSSDIGLSITAPSGGIGLLSAGTNGESIHLVSNSTGKESIVVSAQNGGVRVLGGDGGLRLDTTGDAVVNLEGEASVFRVAAPSPVLQSGAHCEPAAPARGPRLREGVGGRRRLGRDRKAAARLRVCPDSGGHPQQRRGRDARGAQVPGPAPHCLFKDPGLGL